MGCGGASTRSPGLLARLAEVIEAERDCCSFLRFHLRLEPKLGEVALEVTGPEGTKALLADWMAPPATSG